MLLFFSLRAISEGVVASDQNESNSNREYYFTHVEANSSKSAIIVFNNDTTAEGKNIYPFAIKTNMLFDLVGAPNLGVEIPVGREKNFSVAVDAAYAYWRINNLYALQTIQGGVEGKYWFKLLCNTPLTGWNAGIYGMYSSRYDVQWKDGYQGDGFWSAGVSAGYSKPIAKRLNLEFAVAGGYFYTPEVRHYLRPEKGHLLWEETRYNVSRFSLTKLKVNLVWLIGNNEVKK